MVLQTDHLPEPMIPLNAVGAKTVSNRFSQPGTQANNIRPHAPPIKSQTSQSTPNMRAGAVYLTRASAKMMKLNHCSGDKNVF